MISGALIVFSSLVVSITCQASGETKRIHVTTFNVASVPASDIDYKKLLNLDTINELDLPDLVAVGTSDHEKKIHEVLSPLRYKMLDSIRLVGLFLTVYGRSDLSTPRVETSYLRTGFGGLFGNKGGVGLSLILSNRRIVFVNSHLPPHEGHLDERITAYNSINNGLTFDKHGTISDHDLTIWMGDLNMRVHQYSAFEINDAILRTRADGQSWSPRMAEIFEQEELSMVRSQGRAFSGYQESKVEFLPTYKMQSNSDDYNLKRKPAWTDRVLYRINPRSLGISARQDSYFANVDHRASDHRPVTCTMTIVL